MSPLRRHPSPRPRLTPKQAAAAAAAAERSADSEIDFSGFFLGDKGQIAAVPAGRDKYKYLLEVCRSLNSSLHLEDVLTRVLDVVLTVARMDKGFLMLLEEDGRFRLRVARDRKGNSIREDEFPVSSSIIQEVARSQRPLYLADIERALDRDDRGREPHRAIMCFPLKVAVGGRRGAGAAPGRSGSRARTVGLIYVEQPMSSPEFPEVDIDFVEALAGQAAIAIENARLYEALERDRQELSGENVELRREARRRYRFANVIGQSPPMRELYELVARLARSDVNVLLRGESGTGKDLFAKTIHYNSARAKGPFVSLNCAALPEGLLESELFGIEKGVATGVLRRQGKLEQAQGGTFFLDEVGEMSLGLQAKLLRVVETREMERVGGRATITIDVRLVAATNRNLERAIAEGQFREDLYYRLSVVPVELPALRSRRADIPALIDHFLRKHGDSEGRHVEGLTREALKVLTDYDWPGNVRQLENVIQRALILADGPILAVKDLPAELSEAPESLVDEASRAQWSADRLVKEYAFRVLQRNQGNLTRTAREIGMDFKTLKKRMDEFRRAKRP